MDIEKRNRIIAKAIDSGRILAASAPTWAAHFEADPAGTEQTIGQLTPFADIAEANGREVGPDTLGYLEVSLG